MTVEARTPAEEQVFQQIEKDLADGKDPFGDDEPLIPESIEAAAAAAAADLEEGAAAAADDNEAGDEVESDSTQVVDDAAAEPAEDAAPAAEKAAEKAEEAPAPEIEAVAPTVPEPPKPFDVEQRDYAAERKALRDEKKALLKKWSDGELSDDDYSNQTDAVDDKLLTLATAEAKAVAIADINAQNQRRAAEAAVQAEQQAMAQVGLQARKEGLVEYWPDGKPDKVLCGQFDALFTAAKMDPANANLNLTQIALKAHEAVLVLRGLSKPKPKEDNTPPARKPEAAAPITLRGLPNATTPNSGGTVMDALSRLTGDAYERAYSRLTPEQKASLVD